MRNSNPRVPLVSHRRLKPHVSWASAYQFEDVVQSIDDVDLLSVEAEQPSPLPLEERVIESHESASERSRALEERARIVEAAG